MDDDGCTVPMLLQYKDISSLLYSIQYTIYLAGFLLFLLTVLLSCCGGEGVGSSTYLSPHLHSFFKCKIKCTVSLDAIFIIKPLGQRIFAKKQHFTLRCPEERGNGQHVVPVVPVLSFRIQYKLPIF